MNYEFKIEHTESGMFYLHFYNMVCEKSYSKICLKAVSSIFPVEKQDI